MAASVFPVPWDKAQQYLSVIQYSGGRDRRRIINLRPAVLHSKTPSQRKIRDKDVAQYETLA